MSVTTVWILALTSYLVITFGVLPRLRKRVESDLTTSVILPYARYHLFAMLQTVAFATALGALLVVAMLGYLDMRGAASVEEVTHTLQVARKMRDFAAEANIGLSIFIFILLSGGLAWLSFKQAKQRATSLFESIRTEERERVVEALKSDQWEELPPTETMAQIAAIFESKQELLAQAEEAKDLKQVEVLKEELDTLRAAYFHFDVERRVNLQLKSPLAEDLTLPASARLSDRMRNAILNRGVLKSVQGASKILAFLILVALLPSVTTLNLGAGLDAFEQRFVKLDELRVALGKEEADRLLKQALANPAVIAPKTNNESPPVDDSVAKTQIAGAFDQAFIQHVLGRALTVTSQARLNRATVREQILNDFAHASPHNLEAVAGSNATEEFGPLEQARKKVREHIDAIHRENEIAWKSMKASIPSRADFASQISRGDLKQALTGEVFKTAFSGGGADMATAYETYASHYLSSLAQGASIERAKAATFERKEGVFWTAQTEERLHTMQQQTTGNGEMFDRAVRDNAPTLHNRPPPASEVQEAERILRSMPERARTPEALYVYQDLLPGRFGDETRTVAARTAENLGRAGGLGAKAAASVPKPSMVAFERAFSYRSLRGFSRVGGVLIGKPPENESGAANIIDFSWSAAEGDALILSLVAADGKTHKFGPYPTSVVRQALAYAADQRPLAVTMITAKPVPDLKIIAHPVLIDTAVGCRAVMLDRVIDEKTSRSEYRRRAEDVAHASDGLYKLAWGSAVARLVAGNTGIAAEDKKILERLARRSISEALRALGKYETLRPALGGAEETPVSAKPSFYDAEVARVGMACAKESETVEKLAACIRTSPVTSGPEALLAHLPDFQIWSGVREQPYTIDNNLNFLREPAGNDLWPFDFVLQTAFTRKSLIDSDEIRDDSPWEFPALHQRLVNDVGTLIKEDPTRRALLNDMRTFTIVQRLFRVAMNGQLGPRFPVAKLAALSHELNAKTLPSTGYKTPRWNMRPVEDYYSTILRQVGASGEIKSLKVKALARSSSETFLACAKRAAQPARSATGACNLDAVTKTAKLVEDDASIPAEERVLGEEIREMAGVLRLRPVLGVLGPENLSASTCPAL